MEICSIFKCEEVFIGPHFHFLKKETWKREEKLTSVNNKRDEGIDQIGGGRGWRW